MTNERNNGNGNGDRLAFVTDETYIADARAIISELLDNGDPVLGITNEVKQMTEPIFVLHGEQSDLDGGLLSLSARRSIGRSYEHMNEAIDHLNTAKKRHLHEQDRRYHLNEAIYKLNWFVDTLGNVERNKRTAIEHVENNTGMVDPAYLATAIPIVNNHLKILHTKQLFLIKQLQIADRLVCHNCGNGIGKGDHYVLTKDRHVFCDGCFDRNFFNCHHCGKQDRRVYGYSSANGDRYCLDCSIDFMPIPCYFCNKENGNDNMVIIGANGERICNDCIDLTALCNDCGIALRQQDQRIINNQTMMTDNEIEQGKAIPFAVCHHCERQRRIIERDRQRKIDLENKIANGKADKIALNEQLQEHGQWLILRLLREAIGEIDPAYNRSHDQKYLSDDSITAAIGGYDLVTRQGKIGKRTRRNFRRDHGIALVDKTISEIGNIANNYRDPKGDYIAEITTDLDDTIGNFGDSSSCFLDGGMNAHHFIAMKNDGRFSALRVYDSSGKRRSRCWILTANNNTILFNAYGLTLPKIASIYGKANGEQGKAITLSSDIWINGDHGYLFGKIDGKKHSFLLLDGSGDCCENCGDFINMDYDSYHSDPSGNGDLFCEECYHEIFRHCGDCGNDYTIDDTAFFEIADLDYVMVCEECASEYKQCEECGEYNHDPAYHNEENGIALCKDCIDNFTVCGDCGDPVIDGDLYEIGDRYFCQKCGDYWILQTAIDDSGDRRVCDCEQWIDKCGNGITCHHCRTANERNNGNGDYFAYLFDCKDCDRSPFGLCGDHYSAILHNEQERRTIATNTEQRRSLFVFAAEQEHERQQERQQENILIAVFGKGDPVS